MPYTAPARPPVTAATVSVSPPTSTAAVSAASNESVVRSAHRAVARQGQTAR